MGGAKSAGVLVVEVAGRLSEVADLGGGALSNSLN